MGDKVEWRVNAKRSANAIDATGDFIYIRVLLYMSLLSVESTEEVDVPGALDFPGEWLAFVVFANVGEVVGVVAECATDGERPFPWGGGSLCMPFLSWISRRTRSPSWKE
jgi:hypothetical protein